MIKLMFKHSVKISWFDIINQPKYKVSFISLRNIRIYLGDLCIDAVADVYVMCEGEFYAAKSEFNKVTNELTIINKVYPDQSLGQSIDFIEIVYCSRMEDRDRKLEQLGI